MAEGTLIEWARHPATGLGATWNIVTGCSVVSPGCTNCYAMKLAGTRLRNHPSRQGLTIQTKAGPVWNGETRFNEQWLTQPLRWKKPHGIFVAAHGDLFAEGVTDEQLDRIFAVMALTPQHIYYVLTKRPERMRQYLASDRVTRRIYDIVCDMTIDMQLQVILIAEPRHETHAPHGPRVHLGTWPLKNVWLGVSVEDQARANERIPILLDTPAAIRFISAEPLLDPIDLNVAWHDEDALGSECWGDCAWCAQGHPPLHNCARGKQSTQQWEKGRSGIDWVIAGGESGPAARPSHPDWFRTLRDQCAEADVPFFFKQWGSWIPDFEMGFPRQGVNYPSDHPEQSRFPTCIWDDVEKRWDSTNGSWDDVEQWVIADDYWQPEQTMTRIGKKAAGNHLEGIQHLAFPETRT
jgi:protein gp37